MKKYGLAVLSGILVALSFPTVLFGWHLPNLGWLAWVGLVPLILLMYEATPWQAFRYGFFAGSVFYFVSFYWMYTALNTYGHIPPLSSILILLLLTFFMSLYPAAACGLSRGFTSKRNNELLIWFPVFWTLTEWAKNYTPFGGYTWANLGISQTQYLPFIQITDVTGVCGLIFLLVWFNVWLTEAILKWQKREVSFFFPKTIITASFLGIVLGYGLYRIPQTNRLSANAPFLKVGLIQPNISQEEKWEATNYSKQKATFTQAVQSLQSAADLIIWPEASWTQALPLHTKKLEPSEIGIDRRKRGNPFSLVGLISVGVRENKERFFNSAALVDAGGNVLERYHKAHLVPFGEYIPLEKIFSFLKPIAAMGDFEAGTQTGPMALGNFFVAPLICFEDIFPEISRQMTKRGAQLLINMTNDAWYGNSSAPYQHLAFSALRAVENRRAMVRATNTGVSAVIEPTGKVVTASPLFEQSLLLHRVPLLTGETLYTRLGDWFVWGCLLMVLWQGIKIYVQRN